MVYSIESKIQVRGQLRVVKALHVGGFGTSTNIDLPLAVNGQGQVYIPGTSLAGALRGWTRQVMGEELANALWGYQPDPATAPLMGTDKQNKDGHASRVLIEDARVSLASGEAMTPTHMEIRSGVGIDRFRGAAAEKCLYTRGVIPKGATLAFELSVEIVDQGKQETVKNAVEQLLLAMQSEEIRLGAAKSRGLGRVRLENCKQLRRETTADVVGIVPMGMSDRTGMLALLKARQNLDAHFCDWKAPAVTHQRPRLIITLDWQPVGPLMVKSTLTGKAIDILPLMAAHESGESFLLPGSSIKGAVRSQAERIIRTVTDRHLTEASDFLTQIRLPLINELFGIAADEKASTAPNSNSEKSWQQGLGALYMEDCFSQTQHPRNTLQQLSQVDQDQPQSLKSALTSTNMTGEQCDTQLAYHVAVDRWTGGAAENFLYTNLEPFNVPWEPMEWAIDFDRMPISESDSLAGAALLLLLLRDLSNRKIPLGYGTNRGLGTLRIKQVSFEIRGEVPSPLEALAGTTWQAEGEAALSFTGLDSEMLGPLNSVWQTWIQQNMQEVGSDE